MKTTLSILATLLALPAHAEDPLDTARKAFQAIQYRAPLAGNRWDDPQAAERARITLELENQLRAIGQAPTPTATHAPALPPVIEEALPRRLVM